MYMCLYTCTCICIAEVLYTLYSIFIQDLESDIEEDGKEEHFNGSDTETEKEDESGIHSNISTPKISNKEDVLKEQEQVHIHVHICVYCTQKC